MEEVQFSLAALKPSSSYSPFPLTLLGFQVESLYETGWIVPGCVLCLQRTKFCSQHLLPPPAKLMQAAIGHGYGPEDIAHIEGFDDDDDWREEL